MRRVPTMCATQTKSDLPQYFRSPPNATNGNYYVCRTPSTALHQVAGKQKYRQSTGTADLRRAKPIRARLIAEIRAEWEQLLAMSRPVGCASATRARSGTGSHQSMAFANNPLPESLHH